jgi:hypothetical protein
MLEEIGWELCLEEGARCGAGEALGSDMERRIFTADERKIEIRSD